MAVVCPFGVAIAWCNKPIRLQFYIHPPTSTQFRDYMAVRGKCPSSTLPQILGEEVMSQSPPVESIPAGGPPQFHMDLRDLDDAQLRQVMEDIQQEATRREGEAPPMGSPLGQWWIPVGGVNADLEDREVILQGGGDGDLVSCCIGPQAPLEQRRTLVTSSVHLQLD